MESTTGCSKPRSSSTNAPSGRDGDRSSKRPRRGCTGTTPSASTRASEIFHRWSTNRSTTIQHEGAASPLLPNTALRYSQADSCHGTATRNCPLHSRSRSASNPGKESRGIWKPNIFEVNRRVKQLVPPPPLRYVAKQEPRISLCLRTHRVGKQSPVLLLSRPHKHTAILLKIQHHLRVPITAGSRNNAHPLAQVIATHNHLQQKQPAIRLSRPSLLKRWKARLIAGICRKTRSFCGSNLNEKGYLACSGVRERHDIKTCLPVTVTKLRLGFANFSTAL